MDEATISGRAGKATGKYGIWFNEVRHDGKPSQSVDLEKVEFEILNEMHDESEEAHDVMIPRIDQRWNLKNLSRGLNPPKSAKTRFK